MKKENEVPDSPIEKADEGAPTPEVIELAFDGKEQTLEPLGPVTSLGFSEDGKTATLAFTKEDAALQGSEFAELYERLLEYRQVSSCVTEEGLHVFTYEKVEPAQ